tara:strand:+ start:545 stop:1033 length:489 start_codon:yes stop_codon:yes gene_type:complete
MNKYEAVIILNPNLSNKMESFMKDFDSLLSDNSFKILKTEDVGRRQLAYSINNHNKGHYLLFNLEGDPSKLIDIENKIKYNESIIRHLFIVVKEHNGEDSHLLIESKTKKKEADSDDNPVEDIEVKKDDDVKKTKEVIDTDSDKASENAEDAPVPDEEVKDE